MMQIHKIPNQIIKGKLTPLNLGKVDKIILHHMAHPDADVKEIERWHTGPPKNWNAIGYNFWIGFDGTVYEGRGFNVGAHVAGHNSNSIGIGFQGDYHNKPVEMPLEQFNAGIDLIAWLKGKIPTVKRVVGHRDLEANACPGRYFPFAEMAAGKKRTETEETEMPMIYNYIDKNMPEWAHEAVQWAVDNGIVRGTGSGLGLDDQDLQTLVWIYRLYQLIKKEFSK